eukprot:gene11294-18930_t
MGNVQATVAKVNPAPEKDLFRDTPLRFMGYTNEIGEAFRNRFLKLLAPSYAPAYVSDDDVIDKGCKRNVFPKLLAPSYALAFAYVFGDVIYKGQKQYIKDNQKITAALLVKSFDTLLWQSLASVFVPGLVIHKVVDASTVAIKKTLPGKEKILGGLVSTKLIPVALGLSAIPFIVGPIDHGVEVAVDKTIRQTYKSICSLAVPLH